MKRPKVREKMQLQERKERLEMLVVSNKEQLCFVGALSYSCLSPAHPLGPWHLFYDSDHKVVLRRKILLQQTVGNKLLTSKHTTRDLFNNILFSLYEVLSLWLSFFSLFKLISSITLQQKALTGVSRCKTVLFVFHSMRITSTNKNCKIPCIFNWFTADSYLVPTRLHTTGEYYPS